MIMVWDSYGFFSKEYVGLFASLGAKVEVKNLGMVDVDIDLSSSYSVGAIAGYACASSETSIDGTPYGSVDPDEYEYYEKYDMYLYTTSDDLQFCYMPSLQRIDVQKKL